MQISLFCLSSLSMKDAFDELSIAPLDSYIDFCGFGEPQACRLLKGDVTFALNKTAKIRSIIIKFKGTTMVNMGQHVIGLGSTFGHETVMTFAKLKQVLCNKTAFGPGTHVIPWELPISRN